MASALDRRLSRLETVSPPSGLSGLTDQQLDDLLTVAQQQAELPSADFSWSPLAAALGRSEAATAAFIWKEVQ